MAVSGGISIFLLIFFAKASRPFAKITATLLIAGWTLPIAHELYTTHYSTMQGLNSGVDNLTGFLLCIPAWFIGFVILTVSAIRSG